MSGGLAKLRIGCTAPRATTKGYMKQKAFIFHSYRHFAGPLVIFRLSG